LKYKVLFMNNKIKSIRNWLFFFIVALVISGFTAIPVEKELVFLCRLFPTGTFAGNWLDTIYIGFHDTNIHYPFLAYGYDWLAFAHFTLAILFIGPYRNPVQNKWVIEFGIIACLLIIPYAFIAGHFRGIPVWWRLIDCSFGLFGLIPLGICLKKIKQLEPETTNN
jgi:hypothetical protein